MDAVLGKDARGAISPLDLVLPAVLGLQKDALVPVLVEVSPKGPSLRRDRLLRPLFLCGDHRVHTYAASFLGGSVLRGCCLGQLHTAPHGLCNHLVQPPRVKSAVGSNISLAQDSDGLLHIDAHFALYLPRWLKGKTAVHLLRLLSGSGYHPGRAP